jgi:hypothetical protein
MGTSSRPRCHHFGYLGSPPSDQARPRLDPVHRRHLICAPPCLHLLLQCSAWPGRLGSAFLKVNLSEYGCYSTNQEEHLIVEIGSNGPLLIVKGCANAILMALDIYTVSCLSLSPPRNYPHSRHRHTLDPHSHHHQPPPTAVTSLGPAVCCRRCPSPASSSCRNGPPSLPVGEQGPPSLPVCK